MNEFYVDDLRDANGLTQPSNFPAISLVIANIFNGVNAGLVVGTIHFAGNLIRKVWSDGGERRAYFFFVSIAIEAIVTSGVMHSVAHRLFGSTLNGNAYVGKLSAGMYLFQHSSEINALLYCIAS